MICCFTCSLTNVGKPMDSTKTKLTSVTNYLKSEDVCKTVTPNVDEKDVEGIIQIVDKSYSALMPNMPSDDDIEGILHEISEILAVQSIDNSECTDNALLDSDRSVEDILKDAEKLVCSSLAHLEDTNDSSSQIHTSQANKNKKHDTILKSSSKSTNQNSVKFSDVTETIPFQDTIVPIFKTRSRSDPEIILSKKQDAIERREDELKSCRHEASNNTSIKNINNGNSCSEPLDTKKIQTPELKLSDLTPVYEDLNSPNKSEENYRVNADDLDNLNIDSNINNNTVRETIDGIASFVTNAILDNRENIEKTVAPLSNRELTPEKRGKEIIESKLSIAERNRLALLEEELISQSELISSYQHENERLCTDIVNAKEFWKETEIKLLEKIRHAEHQKLIAINKSNNEILNLKEKLRKAEERVKILQSKLENMKEEKVEVEKLNEKLTLEVTRLNCEVGEYKKEMEDWRQSEKEKMAAIENNATIQGKLSQANTEVTRKQTEIVRLNGLIGQLRGELEKIRLGSVINQSSENLTGTISHLQAALAIERENYKDLVKEKESMSKEIQDLRRQVKEMENILIKRSKSGSCIPIGDAYNSDSSEYKELEKKNKALLSDLSQTQAALNLKQQFLNELQNKYDQDIFKLKQELEKVRKESNSLKHSLEERDRGQKPLTAAKEDAHLLATIRGLKAEISTRDKDIVKLNRELDDVRKTNKRLQREREKALNAGNKYRDIHLQKESEKSSRAESSQSSSKDYKSTVYEDQEAVLFLRSENKSLKEEIRKLEQDLISLHNKRIQDLSDLQEQHESEITRMVREHAAKHSSSTVAHLQGQLYTQQMVIHHLKEQIKILEERAEEASLLKAERDHLENSLIEANKKIARLHELQSPESVQYTELLEKLDFLERRHEIREQKLQSIVRDLMSKQGQGKTCSSDCRDKLLNKNREICYYRAEMDKILDTLAEFRWNK